MPTAPVPYVALTMPVQTAVFSLHGGLVTGNHIEQGIGTVVDMDVRRANWVKLLSLPPGTQVGFADVRTVDVHELSPTGAGLVYRITLGDGWYRRKGEGRQYFGVGQYLDGIDLERGLTEVALRTGILLAVMGGVGLRGACWLMHMIFQLNISKSALERHVQECAARLPDAAEMAKLLHAVKPITRVHMDEIFARGQRPKPCTVVLRDEHGRIFAVKQLAERTTAAVTAFLTEVKAWGITPAAFHVDGCDAYREAIQAVFPSAVIQYDYFHVVQNIFKKLWKAMVEHRRDLKRRAEQSTSAEYARRLEMLAKRLWEGRYLLFKRDENMSEAEKAELAGLTLRDTVVPFLRGFQKAVTAIFESTANEEEAKQQLAELWRRSEVLRGGAFAKAVEFLHGRFEDMVAFLRHPGVVQRNSLSETGIRFLRRFEQGHDGFRSAEGLDRHLRIFQAIKYLGWTVHQIEGGLGLPPSSVARKEVPSAP